MPKPNMPKSKFNANKNFSEENTTGDQKIDFETKKAEEETEKKEQISKNSTFKAYLQNPAMPC